MSVLPTNRDVYLAITTMLENRDTASSRDVEEYLRALWGECRARRGSAGVPGEEFVPLLERAFTVPAPAYDPAWAEGYGRNDERLAGFDRFEAVALRQIVDLREMRAAGILDGQWIELGVNAPRGGRWFNFRPTSYLECAAEGALGGWEPGDDTGRSYVPGPVAVLGTDGQITSADPRDLHRPVGPIGLVSWERFAEFLYCGQVYE